MPSGVIRRAARWFEPVPDGFGPLLDVIGDASAETLAGPKATPEQRAAANGKDETILKAIPDRTNQTSLMRTKS